MLAINGLSPELTAENEGISPLPLAANPIEGWSLVQVKVTAPMVNVPNLLRPVFPVTKT
jgi:hypothetical protein